MKWAAAYLRDRPIRRGESRPLVRMFTPNVWRRRKRPACDEVYDARRSFCANGSRAAGQVGRQCCTLLGAGFSENSEIALHSEYRSLTNSGQRVLRRLLRRAAARLDDGGTPGLVGGQRREAELLGLGFFFDGHFVALGAVNDVLPQEEIDCRGRGPEIAIQKRNRDRKLSRRRSKMPARRAEFSHHDDSPVVGATITACSQPFTPNRPPTNRPI